MPIAPMPCLIVDLPGDESEAIIDRLVELGATAVEERDATTLSARPSGRCLLVAGFVDGTARDLALAGISPELPPGSEARGEEIGDDGWSDGWKAFFKPVVLDRLRIITPWMAAPDDGRLNLIIDPGLAFGTGGHPTTRLVLELLEARAAAGLPARILDLGTGSGLLAIAAARLGAASILAVDIDPEALRVTAENAAVNGVATAIRTAVAVPADVAPFALILANIQLGYFEEHGADVVSWLAPGGTLIVSGLLVEHEAAVRATLAGLRPVERREADGWVALTLLRP